MKNMVINLVLCVFLLVLSPWAFVLGLISRSKVLKLLFINISIFQVIIHVIWFISIMHETSIRIAAGWALPLCILVILIPPSLFLYGVKKKNRGVIWISVIFGSLIFLYVISPVVRSLSS